MELGQYQAQVFVSLVVILCAACITAICEFVKNRQNAEGETQPARAAVASSKVKLSKRSKHPSKASSAALAAIERGRQLADVVHAGEPGIDVQTPELATKASPVAEQIERSSEVLPPSASPQPEEVTLPSSEPAKRDWGSVLKSSKVNQQTRPLPMKDRVAITLRPSSSTGLPSGFQDGFVLTKLVQSRQPVTGLVVSIGVQAQRESNIPSIDPMIRTLLEAGDFAAQVAENEYLLIFPSERGLSAERRLAQITQRLAIASTESEGYEILFSCGGLEVRGQAIDQARASAVERMQSVGSGPNITSISPTQVRRAV